MKYILHREMGAKMRSLVIILVLLVAACKPSRSPQPGPAAKTSATEILNIGSALGKSRMVVDSLLGIQGGHDGETSTYALPQIGLLVASFKDDRLVGVTLSLSQPAADADAALLLLGISIDSLTITTQTPILTRWTGSTLKAISVTRIAQNKEAVDLIVASSEPHF